MKTANETRTTAGPLNKCALILWILGTFCLPVWMFYRSAIYWLLDNTGIAEPVWALIISLPTWLVVATGPLLAIVSALFMSRSKSDRINFLTPPIAILLVIICFATLTHLALDGWPAD